MLLLTGIKNIRGHYARKQFYVYNQSPVPIRTFHPTTWLGDRRNRNACDSPFEAEKQRAYHGYSATPANIIMEINTDRNRGRSSGGLNKTQNKTWWVIGDCWRKVGDNEKWKFIKFVSLVIIKIEILINFDQYKK